MVIRTAHMNDVRNMQQLVNAYAQKGEMLPLSLHEIYEGLREFSVAEKDNNLIGICALHICWENLGEIRSLAVHPDYLSQGIGRSLVQSKLEEAKKMGINRIFALTYRDDFFKSLNFQAIDKSELPHKVWADCIKCVKFPDCDENAYVFDFTPA